MNRTRVQNLFAALALCLVASACSSSKPGASVPLYNSGGKVVVLVDKNDLNTAAPGVTYRLRKEVWARLGDVSLSLASMAGRAALAEWLDPMNDSNSK